MREERENLLCNSFIWGGGRKLGTLSKNRNEIYSIGSTISLT